VAVNFISVIEINPAVDGEQYNGFCVYGNELSGFINCEDFLGCYLLRNDSAPGIYLSLV
jgi:hypothetical protein